jgi:hypothetical protein
MESINWVHKEGDMLLCKKEIELYRTFQKLKYYKITKDDSQLGMVYVEKCYFDSFNPWAARYVWNYFYTPQEERKLKIKKLERY